ncbi:major virion protein [Aeropyrum globular virus 1]|uniref:major virion protein n=1 Tax=Aeropyrum globular virus 1 TaxID=1932713 RepID=UPI000C7F518D|nr:major virion protein [Aeropyrum globular virus 1]BBC20927.1 major virion protein [Aeropyrum globular virus 1]
MNKAVLAVLAPLLALLLALAPVASAAGPSGVAYLPPSVAIEGAIQHKALEGYSISIPASDGTTAQVVTVDLSQYLPSGFDVDGVRLIVESTASDKIVVKALDANSNVLAQADVVPLSSGYEVTLPAGTTQLQFESLSTTVWEGTITVIVESAIDIDLVFQSTQITLTNGYAEVPAQVKVYNSPAGELFLTDDRLDFEVKFKDTSDNDTRVEIQAHNDPANPAIYDTIVAISTSAEPGTYTIKVTMWLYNNALNAEYEIDSFDFTVTLEGDGSGTATVSEQAEELSLDWGMIGLGAVAAVVIVFLLARAR